MFGRATSRATGYSYIAKMSDKEELEDQLRSASLQGDIETVRQLLQSGVHVNATDEDGRSSLMWACWNGDAEVVRMLLSAGAHVNHQNKNERSSLMWACWNSHAEVVRMLLSAGAHVNHQDKNGYTALHMAAERGYGGCVRLLLSTPGIDANLVDHRGNTPLKLATGYEVLTMLQKYTTSCEDFPVHTYGKVILCGDSGAGKSTLTEAIKDCSQSMSEDGEGDQQATREPIGNALTTGIISHRVKGPKANMTIYDLAGHREYYSSQSSILEHISNTTPSIFLLLVNLLLTLKEITAQLYYWYAMIGNVCKKCSQQSSIIVVGTHADCISDEGKLVFLRTQIEQVARDAIKQHIFVRFTALNVTSFRGEVFGSFISLLYSTIDDVRLRLPAISLTCHVMYAFLNDKVPADQVAISLSQLLNLLSQEYPKVLPTDVSEVSEHLKVLSDKGFIVFFESDTKLDDSWIVFRPEALLEKVNGVLFAPSKFKEHLPIASNTGLIPISVLKRHFPEPKYNIDMITQFLVRYGLCQRIMFASTSTNAQGALNYTSCLDLFFPLLVSANRPDNAIIPDNAFIWQICCTNINQFFSPCFLHVLVSRIADQFPFPTVGPCLVPELKPYNRRCTVWSRGICWRNKEGFSTMIEMREDFQCLLCAVSTSDKSDIHYSQLILSVINVIKVVCDEFCPSVSKVELITCPPEATSDHVAAPVECEELKEMLLNGMTTMADLTGKKVVNISQWSKMEPQLSHLLGVDHKQDAIKATLNECDHGNIFQSTKSACDKWRAIGWELGFTSYELDSIVRECGRNGDEDYYEAMLRRWLDWALPNHTPPSLQSLQSALRASGKERQANDLATNVDAGPPSPIGLKANGISSTSVAISWQPPDGFKGTITKYQVSYTKHGGSEQLCDVQDTTSTELSSLEPDTEYTICVRAKMGGKFGEHSSPISIRTSETAELLSAKLTAILDNYKTITFKQLRTMKLIFYGAPRAGKTTLRKQILRHVAGLRLQPCDSIEPSTNTAEMCGCIFVERIIMSNEEDNKWQWTVQKSDDIAKALLLCLDNKQLQSEMENSDSLDTSLNKSTIETDLYSVELESNGVQQTPNQEHAELQDLDVSKARSWASKEKVSDPIHLRKTAVTNERMSTGLEIKELFQKAVKTGQWAEVVGALNIDKAMFLQIIDGGGQPSFQEIFPLLISGPSVTLLIFKLTDNLEKLLPVKHQPEDGIGGPDAWPDTYIVKDIIFHALASFVSQKDKDTAKPFLCKVLLVGTHKDKLDDSQDVKEAKIKNITAKLYGWLHKSKAFESIHVRSMEDLITSIDNNSTNDIEQVKKKIQELISQLHSQDIPAPWLVFDFVLHSYAKSNQLRKVKISDCEKIAHSCGINSDKIKVVLYYLHYEAGTLLYYSDIPKLNEYVIIDFQLIFDSISKIIIQYFDNNSVDGPHLIRKKSFKQEGMLDESVLKHVKGCLEVDELLTLLHHRHIISKIEETKVYFMPSVLPKEELSFNQLCNSSSFLVLFDHGYCPVGLFCAATTRLIVEHNWEIKPGELQYRNKINFFCKCSDQKLYNVIFSAFPAHFEVCLVGGANSPQAKCTIYQTINDVFAKVCKDMKYPSPSYGYYCPMSCTCKNDNITYPQYQHPATCKFNYESQQMICYYSHTPSDLKEEHKQWFSQEQVVSHEQKKDASSSSTCKLKDLVNDVAFKIPDKWKFVGIQLELSSSTLNSIQADAAGKTRPCLESFFQVLSIWEKELPSPFTWDVIIDVLKTPAVGEVALAEELNVKYNKSKLSNLTQPTAHSSTQ